VRVGYNRAAFDAVQPASPAASWVSLWGIWSGLWKNRLARWLTTPWFEEREVRGRIEAWKREGEKLKEKAEEGDVYRYDGPGVKEEVEVREEKGGFCVIDEMQVLVHNGWKHV
jgi:hypothetical protein